MCRFFLLPRCQCYLTPDVQNCQLFSQALAICIIDPARSKEPAVGDKECAGASLKSELWGSWSLAGQNPSIPGRITSWPVLRPVMMFFLGVAKGCTKCRTGTQSTSSPTSCFLQWPINLLLRGGIFPSHLHLKGPLKPNHGINIWIIWDPRKRIPRTDWTGLDLPVRNRVLLCPTDVSGSLCWKHITIYLGSHGNT